MSTDIHGWVEVKLYDYWVGVIHISRLMRRNYPMFDFLFGGRSENYETAIAGMRGDPPNPSEEYKDWGGGQTWIIWKEIQSIDWSKHENILSDDWRRLFKMMELLSEDPRFEDIRLVVSFD
jgi:hypothetical protein